jgi:two-component system, OmpR family, alkaline phosphatase synthesis response regulator PhoP
MKILIAEDDPFLMKVYRMTFEQEGYDIILAEDGEQALFRLQKECPDIMLLDILMPKMDGFDVLREIQKDKKCKGIPIIVLSNLGQESDVAKAKELGAVDYAIKGDTDIEDVVAKVKQYVGK